MGTSTKRQSSSTGRPPPSRKSRQSKVPKPKQPRPEKPPNKTSIKRPDRGERIKKNNKSKFTAIKSSLLGRWGTTWCPPDMQTIMDEKLEAYVESLSKMYVRGSQVANEVILEYLRNGETPNMDSTLSTLFHQCMTGETSDLFILSVLDAEFSNYPTIQRHTGDWVSLNYLANQYTTNFKINLWMPFESRVLGYIKDWASINNIASRHAKTILRRIFGRPFPSDDAVVFPQSVLNFIQEEREALNNPEQFYPDTNTSKTLLLKYMFRILEYKRLHNCPGGFSIAPLPDTRRDHIVIDTSTLYVIIRHVYQQL